MRKLYDLTLVRDQHPVFKLGWTVMHIVDETSPLFGETAETLNSRGMLLLLTLEGVDDRPRKPCRRAIRGRAIRFTGSTVSSTS